MASPGFPSGSTFMPGTTEMNMQSVAGTTSGVGGSPVTTVGNVGGSSASGMGALQMAVGFAELRRAKRLPFPGYMAAAAPLAAMKSIYQNQMTQGIGSEQRANLRMQGNRINAQQMNAVAGNTAQSSQLLGRTASLNRTSAELRLAQAEIEAKQNAMAGVERMNNAMSAIKQRDIAAQRDYRILAEKSAGAAIKRGSENIAGYLAEDRLTKTA